MTVKNFLYYLSLILLVAGGIFGLNTVGSDNEVKLFRFPGYDQDPQHSA